MPSAPTLLAFAAAAARPASGPNLLYIISRGIAQGRRAALASTLGVTAATAVFVVLTAFGLTALISSSVVAFSVVKYAGVAYLVYLAVREFRSTAGSGWSSSTAGELPAGFRRRLRRGYHQPEGGAVLPRLLPAVRPRGCRARHHAGPRPRRGLRRHRLTFDSTYALASGAIGGWLAGRPRVMGRSHYVSGAVYLALGGAALLTDSTRRA